MTGSSIYTFYRPRQETPFHTQETSPPPHKKASRESGLYVENRHTGSIAGYKNRMPRRDKLVFVQRESYAHDGICRDP